MDCPLDIDRASWQLIRRYGDESAKIAFRLYLDSTIRGDEIGASQWKLVIKWIADLQFNEPEGMLH